MADINKAIRLVVKTGKVTFGFKETLEALRGGKTKLVVYANNIPEEKKKRLQDFSKFYETPQLQYAGSGIDLGVVCGKPFNISAVAVKETGDSDILKLVK